MKIFHEENGKQVVYVQMEDIMHLNHTDLSIPASIFVKVFGDGIVIVDNSNRFEFVKFEEEHEVTFFKEVEFIIDYDKYKDYTNEQLEKEGQKLAISAIVGLYFIILQKLSHKLKKHLLFVAIYVTISK